MDLLPKGFAAAMNSLRHLTVPSGESRHSAAAPGKSKMLNSAIETYETGINTLGGAITSLSQYLSSLLLSGQPSTSEELAALQKELAQVRDCMTTMRIGAEYMWTSMSSSDCQAVSGLKNEFERKSAELEELIERSGL